MLPSQLESVSTGQTFFKTFRLINNYSLLQERHVLLAQFELLRPIGCCCAVTLAAAFK